MKYEQFFKAYIDQYKFGPGLALCKQDTQMLNGIMEHWLGSYYTEKVASNTNANQSVEERKEICSKVYTEAQKYIT